MNEVLKVLKERRSIRAFRPEPLKKEDLDAIVEAGLYAPSAKNLQSTKLVVVRDAAVLARLERLNSRILGTPEGTPFYGAPEAIVVLSDSEYPNWLQDGSLVMGNLMNAAAALGIGSCWINRAMETFELPEGKAGRVGSGRKLEGRRQLHFRLYGSGCPGGQGPERGPRSVCVRGRTMNEAIRQVTHVQNIRYDKATERLYIIDQTLLPNEEKEIELRTVEEMIEAIKMLRIRGAPAIGICAGYCMYALARDIDAKDNETFYRKLQIDGELLGAARPTAVNLRWAVGEMLDAAKAHLKDNRAELLEVLYRKAVDIHEDDIAKCTAISECGLSLLKDGDGVLTHCNAGPLATSRYGTGQGPFLLAAERGIHIRVFADETRPLLQGARLTSYELQRAGVDVTLICDNMASMVMKNGWVQACFVGCDRIAANGDFANKIGTSGVAILAKHYGIPVYTLGPTSTIDMNCPDGAHIPIELRDGDEIKNLWYEKPMALPEVKCFNPSFDVTDHELLTGIVTEKGICYPPFNESLAALFKDKE